MPKMETDGGAVAFGFPVELFIVQVVREAQDNFVDILETIKDIIEGGGGHKILMN
jgi:hypothetical protein